MRRLALMALPLVALAGGLALQHVQRPADAALLWSVGIVPALVALLAQMVVTLGRGQVGLDIIAGLSMSAALAFGEPLAGNVVAVMYLGGQWLESFAEGRAGREMAALLGRVASTALRHAGGRLVEVPISALQPGDRILVRTGEVVPADGRVATGTALLDASALTGESVPVPRTVGEAVLSGTTSIGAPFDLDVERAAAESTYAGIVRLVEAAQASRAPMARLADRYALVMLVATVVISGTAWFLAGDPTRALAVLVVATPCPLILAVPVAMMSGLSRTARLGVLVKSGGALERLAQVRVAVLDKTGTLTHGVPGIRRLDVAPGWSAGEVLHLAASLDQASRHSVADTLLRAAEARHLGLALPSAVVETPGMGIRGVVDGRDVAVGGLAFVRSLVRADGWFESDVPETQGLIAVAVDGALAALVFIEDELRPDAAAVVAAFRAVGVRRIVLASGDRAEVAQAVGAELGLDEVLAELRPEAKVAVVREQRSLGPVMMVGDGVNDAPALVAADVGVAMGARGAAASSEAADVVVLVDELSRLPRAMAAARRARLIALQSVVVGLGLSFAAMLVAAAGYLPPVQGAVLQEVIDVAVILNALRALGGGETGLIPRPAASATAS
ncbi:heavy metal translocating P-type ATPase [Ancylobacter lacus]|uniref:heavy metal translocating P-type ATPase n=1 Tax=Ancylobacter lacus TaxID=2579970 RepID=UPI001BCEFDC9|nr:heavy metal translocating P-type ATPase [Ancylobacter lacus]MBS7541357.1 cadmium-translocating P-type ATPase [Ancylobacter lacus]